MKTITAVRQYIEKLPQNESFTVKNVQHLGAYENVRKILNRMVLSGEIVRIARGVFTKPKTIAKVGLSLPSLQKTVNDLVKLTGETIAIHGAEAARQLGLTTQAPMQTVFNTTGNTRQIKIGNRKVFLKHVSPSKLVATDSIIGVVISALWYLGKENVNVEIIEKIKSRLSKKEFNALLKERRRMPAWMAETFFQHEKVNINE